MAREMKDSGIPWIGTIPLEWSKNKLLRLFRVIGSGTTPRSTDDSAYLRGDVPWIQSGDINGGKIASCKYMITHDTVKQNSALRVYCAPFIIVAMYGASIGNMCVSMLDGCVNQACCVLSEATQSLEYLIYLIKSSKDYLVFKGIGGGQPNISQEIIRQLWLPMPQKNEQRLIANFLDHECAEIDAVLEKTRASIEEYKKLKQAVITQAVTKGIRGERPMKDSGVAWVGEVPKNWGKSKLKYCARFAPTYETTQLSEDATITFTPMECIHNGYFDNNAAPLSSIISSYTQYGEGDIVIAKVTPCFENGNIAIMDGLFSGIGYGSSELFVLHPTNICTKFLFYFLQNTMFKQFACATMTGTGGLKRVSPSFLRNFVIALPDSAEQHEIADYLDKRCAEIDAVIAKKQALITELETYKKSLIYEHVTGKKEVTGLALLSETDTTNMQDWQSALITYQCIRLLGQYLDGRVKLQKAKYLIENELGIQTGAQYVRAKHGPYDRRLQEYENILQKRGWITVQEGNPVKYSKTSRFEEGQSEYLEYFAAQHTGIRKIIHFLRDMNTSECERVATLFAAWNDFIINGVGNPTDAQIITDVTTNWTENKANPKYSTWQGTLDKMKKASIVPHGFGSLTSKA